MMTDANVRFVPPADISRSGKPRRHSAGGSPQPISLPLGQGSQVYRFVLDVIEVTCAGVTELPSVEDARHCWLIPIHEARVGRTI
jgi:hypothetical protein